MKNKVSTTSIAVPMENKKAKARLKEIQSHISEAETKKAKILEDKSIILGASQDKETVLAELDATKTELSNAQNELATAKQKKADIVDETIKCSETLRLRQADLAELNGLKTELEAAKVAIGERANTLEQQNQESHKLALQIEAAKSTLAGLEVEQNKKIKEATQNLQKLSDDAKNAEAKLKTADEELNKVELDVLDRKKELEKLQEDIKNETSAKDNLIAQSDALKLDITNKIEECNKKLDAELATKQADFDKSIVKKQEELSEREGELALREKRFEKKRKEAIETYKNLEDRYGHELGGRKLPRIVF